MGYTYEISKLCIEAFNNDLQKIINYLSEKNKPSSELDDLMIELKQIISYNNKIKINKIEKIENSKEILKNLASEMPEDDEAYLDLNLEEDMFYIKKYYSYLGI